MKIKEPPWLREAFKKKKKNVTFVTLGVDPPPDFEKSVTIFFIFFWASRPCDWNFLSKEFFSKMLGNFFNLGSNFSQNFGLTDKNLGADPPPPYTKLFFTKNAPFGMKWMLSSFFESVTFGTLLTPPPNVTNVTLFFEGFPKGAMFKIY